MAFSINDRRLIGGPTNNLMQIRPVKYGWAKFILEQMQNNSWDQREVDLTEDAKQFATGKLTDGNLMAYKKALAFLSNLDGIQLNSLTMNIGKYITAPEVSMCIARQAWEEAQHVLSYAQMIESIGFDTEEIYWAFEHDDVLAEKNELILESSSILGKTYTEENFIKAVVANIALEGIYFFNGFLTFYVLERQGLMRGSAKMIQFIQRDEEGTHLQLFLNMWHTLKQELPHLFTNKLILECYRILELAVAHEIVWGKHIIKGGVLGLTDKVIADFVQWLCDERLSSMGLEKSFGSRNSVSWFQDSASIHNGETNFFENKQAAYTAGGALEWD